MICFLLRPLSVSALQQKRERWSITGLSTHVPHQHTHPHTETAVVILIRSSTMPNNCSHSKVPTNHWTEFHPLGTVCQQLRNRPCHCFTGISPVHSQFAHTRQCPTGNHKCNKEKSQFVLQSVLRLRITCSFVEKLETRSQLIIAYRFFYTFILLLY